MLVHSFSQCHYCHHDPTSCYGINLLYPSALFFQGPQGIAGPPGQSGVMGPPVREISEFCLQIED